MFKTSEKFSEINKMAVPLIINSIMLLFLGLVDQAMVGRVSLFAFGAVGLITNSLYGITGILGMLSVAFTILGSKSNGQDDKEDLLNKFNISIFISVALGLLFFLVIFSFRINILETFFGLNGKLLGEAQKFLSIYGLTTGIDLVLFIFSAYFKIVNRTKWILIGSLTAGVSNIIFDYILIFGKFNFPAMGVTGAAIGSVLALLLNLLVYIIAFKKYSKFSNSFTNFVRNAKEIFSLSVPLIGQELLEGTLFILVINAIVARIGALEVSAFSLIFTIINIILMPMYAYSSTAMTLVSQNAESKNDMIAIPKICTRMSLAFYFGLTLVVILAKNYIPGIITNNDGLIQFSSLLIPVAILAQMFNFPHSVYKFSLQGVRQERWVLKISTVVNLICILAVCCMVFELQWGLTGVYVGIGVNYFVLSGLFYYRYRGVLAC